MDGNPIGLSPLFTWRSVISSEDGPKDVELELENGRRTTVTGATQRHIALVLSLHMSERGDSCFPAISTLVTESGRGERTVQRAIAALRQEGWLEVRQGGTWRGKKVANTYRAAWAPAYLESREGTGVTVTPVGREAGVTVTGNGRHGDGVGRKDLTPKAYARTRENGNTSQSRPLPASHDPSRLEAWIANLGIEYSEDAEAFRGELRDRFGIEGAPAEELRLECLSKLEVRRQAAA